MFRGVVWFDPWNAKKPRDLTASSQFNVAKPPELAVHY